MGGCNVTVAGHEPISRHPHGIGLVGPPPPKVSVSIRPLVIGVRWDECFQRNEPWTKASLGDPVQKYGIPYCRKRKNFFFFLIPLGPQRFSVEFRKATNYCPRAKGITSLLDSLFVGNLSLKISLELNSRPKKKKKRFTFKTNFS